MMQIIFRKLKKNSTSTNGELLTAIQESWSSYD